MSASGAGADDTVDVDGVCVDGVGTAAAPVSQETLMLSCLCCQQVFAPHDAVAASAAAAGDDPDPISDAPYILTPCGHVVCGACASAAKANSNRCVFGHCNVEVAVPNKPDSGIMELAKSVAIAAALAMVAQSAPQCALCGDDGVLTDAAAYCTDCSEAICEKHTTYHKRRGHAVSDVAPAGAVGAASSPNRAVALTPAQLKLRCEVHPANELKLQCSKCNAFVCSECVPLPLCRDNSKHSASPAVHQIKRLRELVASSRECVAAASLRLNGHAGSVTAQLSRLLANNQAAHTAIDAAEADLMQRVAEHCSRLRRTVDACADERVKQLQGQCDGLLVNASQCDAVVAVLTAALEADDPVKFGSALACSTAASGLTVDTFEGLCASEHIAVQVSDGDVVADALANLAVVSQVCFCILARGRCSSSQACSSVEPVDVRVHGPFLP